VINWRPCVCERGSDQLALFASIRHVCVIVRETSLRFLLVFDILAVVVVFSRGLGAGWSGRASYIFFALSSFWERAGANSKRGW